MKECWDDDTPECSDEDSRKTDVADEEEELDAEMAFRKLEMQLRSCTLSSACELPKEEVFEAKEAWVFQISNLLKNAITTNKIMIGQKLPFHKGHLVGLRIN